jgi:hypothetical protein
MIDDLKAEGTEVGTRQMNSGLRISGTAPGNRRPPLAELSDCGLCKTNPIPDRRDTPAFHCSIIPPFQPDADCAKRSQFEEG